MAGECAVGATWRRSGWVRSRGRRPQSRSRPWRAGQRLPSLPRMGTRGLRVIRSLPSSWLPRRSRIGQARRRRPNGSSGHPGGQTRTWGPAQPGVQAGDQQGNISALLAASGHCPRSCARNVPWAGALWHGYGTDAGILRADPSSRLRGRLVTRTLRSAQHAARRCLVRGDLHTIYTSSPSHLHLCLFVCWVAWAADECPSATCRCAGGGPQSVTSFVHHVRGRDCRRGSVGRSAPAF